MTTLLHTFPDSIDYDKSCSKTDLDYLFSSEAAQNSLAENYRWDCCNCGSNAFASGFVGGRATWLPADQLFDPPVPESADRW